MLIPPRETGKFSRLVYGIGFNAICKGTYKFGRGDQMEGEIGIKLLGHVKMEELKDLQQ